MKQRFVITLEDCASRSVILDGKPASSLVIKDNVSGKLVLKTGSRLDWHLAGMGGESSGSICLPNQYDTELVFADGADGSLILSDGEHLSIRVRDAGHSSLYDIPLGGLVSDGQLIDFTGTLALAAATTAAELNFPVNLKTGGGVKISTATDAVDLRVLRELFGKERLRVSLTGSVFVSKALDGEESVISVGTESTPISAAVLAVLSDWTEHTIAQMTEQTLDELIYKEV